MPIPSATSIAYTYTAHGSRLVVVVPSLYRRAPAAGAVPRGRVHRRPNRGLGAQPPWHRSLHGRGARGHRAGGPVPCAGQQPTNDGDLPGRGGGRYESAHHGPVGAAAASPAPIPSRDREIDFGGRCQERIWKREGTQRLTEKSVSRNIWVEPLCLVLCFLASGFRGRLCWRWDIA